MSRQRGRASGKAVRKRRGSKPCNSRHPTPAMPLTLDASFLRWIVVAADPGVDAAVDEQLELPGVEHVHNVGVEAGFVTGSAHHLSSAHLFVEADFLAFTRMYVEGHASKRR